MKNFPGLTLIVMSLCIGLFSLPAAWHTHFYLHLQPAKPWMWQWLTGHLMHVDLTHLFWNMLALGVLGCLIERHTRMGLIQAGIAGVVGVNLALFFSADHLYRYCGLSGVLNTLFVFALGLQWRARRSVWVVISAILYLFKLCSEMLLQHSLFSQLSWSAYPPSHLAGAVAGVFLFFCLRRTGIHTPASMGKEHVNQSPVCSGR